jgi:RimJ/RimL family protein N-acetyltransferase
MSGERVRLRDATLDDAKLLDAWGADAVAQGEFNDFGMEPARKSSEVLAKGPLRNEENGLLVVELAPNGTPIGTVSWHKIRYGPNPESDAWNVGIALLPEARGKGYGTEAQAQLARLLFRTTDVNRVEASTDVENVAEQRSLEKAGFVREGLQRGAQFRAGAYHDLVTYSRLRHDRD